jgi:hypothetical protein
MDLQIVNPAKIPDWDSRLLLSGDQSFFHSAAWARVLEEEYGYRPVYFVSFQDHRLSFLMPLMEVSSLLTRKRGVSLPFTDGCAPYCLTEEPLQEAVRAAIDLGTKANWRYVEWRDGRYFDDDITAAATFFTHDLDLEGSEAELFDRFRDSNRKNLRRAEKENVDVTFERSPDALRAFFRLKCITIKRHGLPPQPFSFFEKVHDHVLSQGRGIIVSAHHSGRVIASAVFFQFGTTAIYKYAASDMRFQSLRPNNMVLWEAIRWHKAQGFRTLNLGRTDAENSGLLRFKRSWGAKEAVLKYYRYDIRKKTYIRHHPRPTSVNKILARTPAFALRWIGKMFYRHIG